MKQLSIGQMIQKLKGARIPREFSDFVRIAAEKSDDCADTSKLSDKEVELVSKLYWENCA